MLQVLGVVALIFLAAFAVVVYKATRPTRVPITLKDFTMEPVRLEGEELRQAAAAAAKAAKEAKDL